MNSRQVVSRYVRGWLKGDLSLIVDALTEDATIIESDMATYKGLAEIRKWIKNWNTAGSVVNSWKIKSFFEDQEVFVLEWHFKCTVKDNVHEFDGISIGKVQEGKIEYLREYRVKI